MKLFRKFRNGLLGLNHVAFLETNECKLESIMSFLRKFIKRLLGLNPVVFSEKIEC